MCNYIDLFAGCGGLSLGFYNAGWHGLFAIEKNRDAFMTLKTNLIDSKKHFIWPEWLPHGPHDINEVLSTYRDKLLSLRGKVDLVAGGPPCQGFSMAGKRNQDDTRNTLCQTYVEFIDLVRPKVILFENVHGFTVAFKKIKQDCLPYSTLVMNALERLGYSVCGKIVDVSEYGVPQKRKRFIIIGSIDHNPHDFFALLPRVKESFLASQGLSQSVNVHEAIGDLCKVHGVEDCPDSHRFLSGKYGPCISVYQTYMRRMYEANIPDSHRYANQRENTLALLKKLMEVSPCVRRISPSHNVVPGLKKRGVTPLKAAFPCNTVTSIPDDYIHYTEPRILTVRETARIQSFPDWYLFKGKYTSGGVLRKLDVPRYTQVANAVPPLFSEQIALAIKELIK